MSISSAEIIKSNVTPVAGKSSASVPAGIYLRGMASLLEAMVFLALSIPVVFLMPAATSRLDAATIAPGLPGFFFMEGFLPGVNFPVLCMSLWRLCQSSIAAMSVEHAQWASPALAPLSSLATPVAKITGMSESMPVVWLSIIAGLLMVNLLYHSILESSPAQGTIGKMVIGMKVVRLDGSRPSFFRAVARNLLRILSMALFFGGYFMVARTSNKQALHDKLSGCLVVRSD